MNEQTCSCVKPARLCSIALRHRQPRHQVEGSTPYEQFDRLTVKIPRTQPLREAGLETKHACLGQTALMIARLLFPTLAAYFADGSQVLVTIQALLLGVGMHPDTRSLPRRNKGFGPLLPDGLVAVAGVISPIGGHTLYRSLHLLDKFGQDLAVGIVVGTDHGRHDLLGICV